MHRLVLGTTGSGKSTYCKWTCEALSRSGEKTIVYNPYRQPGWTEICTEEYSDLDSTLSACMKNERKHLFLEEAGTLERDPRWDVFTTYLRNTETHTFVVAQQLTMLRPNLRKQCEEIILFRCALSDGRDLADEYREPALNYIGKFQPLQFFVISHTRGIETSALDFKTKSWPALKPWVRRERQINMDLFEEKE